MATPPLPSAPREDATASVVAEWVPEAESLALTVGGDSSKQSAGTDDELRVTDTIEFNFVALPPLGPPPSPPAPDLLGGGLSAWTLGGLLLFLLANGALLARQFFSPMAAPTTPLEQLSSLSPWQEAPLLSSLSLSPESSLSLGTLSSVPPPLPAPPKLEPPVAVAPRLTAPPPPPTQSWPQPLAAQILTPLVPVQATPPPTPLPTLAVRPANLTPPPPPPDGQPPNPIEGNPPINLFQIPVPPENSSPSAPSLEQVRQQLQPQLEPSPSLSFNAQTRQRLLKMQNPAMQNPAPSSAPADITEIDRTQQLIQELESLNQAP